MKKFFCLLPVCAFAVSISALPASTPAPRETIPLDGSWNVGEGGMEQPPNRFDHVVPVPGLLDMAQPAFADVGRKSARREAFWYRRTFQIEQPVPEVAILKIQKAAYGSRVYVNGKLAGEHPASFTPGLFNVRPYIKGPGETNEVVIRLGAFRDAVPPSIPSGWDFEKVKYIPGIFDSVELILSGSPHLDWLQVAPDLDQSAVRVQAMVRNAGRSNTTTRVHFRIREWRSPRLVAEFASEAQSLAAGAERRVDVRIPIPAAHLWSPNDPFLYVLEATTAGDQFVTRFGMRSFRFDPASGRAYLNGKRFFLRGSNVTLYRFFEDPERGDRPWREDWVRRLHRAFRGMHWNSLRYCIGFPPEAWYRIADEEGFLIQDEFPLWHLDKYPAELKSDELAREYAEWIRERANHPCVVIWDAQNETRTDQTGQAIDRVRHLDLSHRPWDNGWAPPRDPADVFESHPYLFSNPQFKLAGLAGVSGVPRGNPIANTGANAIVINEYGWLWLNRDGTPTTLTRKVYENLLGPESTTAQRRHLYARYLAALTEFWRCHRAAAGVLHFCGLGYSRPDGQTSDHFVDLEALEFEPEFKRYVGDAFAPVGLMVDWWKPELAAGQKVEVPVILVNDLEQPCRVAVHLALRQGEKTLIEQRREVDLPGFGSERLTFSCAVPNTSGPAQWVATLERPGARPVQSWRDATVATDVR